MLKIQSPLPGDSRVLLHSCCAPCSSAIVECMMANGLRPTMFYYNPNIYPREEYDIRKQEAIRFTTSLGLDFVDADYDHSAWLDDVQGLEGEPERGRRCLQCFTLRLTATARYAAWHGFRVFTTTLASSRWKSLDQINEAGRRAAALCPGTIFWEQNWQRRPAGTPQPAAPGVWLLQPAILWLRVQPAGQGGKRERHGCMPHLGRKSVLLHPSPFKSKRNHAE